MGGCCASEKSIDEYVQEIKSLSVSNLGLLKALIVIFIEDKMLGMAVQLVKVRNITQKYYSDVSSSRKERLRFKSHFDREEWASLRSILVSEKQELQTAYTLLQSKYASFRGNSMLFLSGHSEYIKKRFENSSCKDTYDRIKQYYRRSEVSGQEIAQLSKILNYGNELSPELKQTIREICNVTSHIATNKDRRISYLETDSTSNLHTTPEIMPRKLDRSARNQNNLLQVQRYIDQQSSLDNKQIQRIIHNVPEINRHESFN